MPKCAIGIGGRIGSGKTTLARALAVHFDGVIVPLACAVKGAALSLCGPMAFFPQVGKKERMLLQFIGHYTRENHFENLWIAIADTVSKATEKDCIIIPDVRYDNEAQWIWRLFEHPLVVVLQGNSHIKVDEEISNHPSERSLKSADVVLDCSKHVSELVSEVISLFKRMHPKFEIKPRRVKVYVSGNIFGCKDFQSKFEHIAELLSFEGLDPVVPALNSDFIAWSESFIESPKEASWERVTNDLRLLSECDALLAWLTAPSIGAAIEIFSAALMQKFVVAIVPENMLVHPFLNAFATLMSVPNPSEIDDYAVLTAIAKIKDAFGLKIGGVIDAAAAASVVDGNSWQ